MKKRNDKIKVGLSCPTSSSGSTGKNKNRLAKETKESSGTWTAIVAHGSYQEVMGSNPTGCLALFLVSLFLYLSLVCPKQSPIGGARLIIF